MQWGPDELRTAQEEDTELNQENILWWCTVTGWHQSLHQCLRSVERYPVPDVQSGQGQCRTGLCGKFRVGQKEVGQATPP
ncbi:hypothetical protein MHYP_G00244960 [Metynnis hypsauchen]